MRRDPLDRRRSERVAGSFLASLFVHGLLALLLFSLATTSSEQSPPEEYAGAAIVTVSSRAVPQPVREPPAPVPPQAARAPQRRAALPRSAAPHPRVLHDLAVIKPHSTPVPPTPAPVSSAPPNPVPTQAAFSVTPAPLEPALPSSMPTAAAVAVTVKAPATASPRPPMPTAAPVRPTARPRPPAPSAAPQTPVPRPAASPQKTAAAQHGAAPSPGPKAAASAGPEGAAKSPARVAARPVQPLPATPRPAPVKPRSTPSGKQRSLNERLRNLIPTGAPVTPEPPKEYRNLAGIRAAAPPPEPTPPPDVIARTKYLFVENVAGQRWKQSWLGTKPEERYVKMYVTSVKRIGFINWCTGWVVRSPMNADVHGELRWIVEPHESLICSGRLQEFVPAPASSPTPAA